MTWTVHPSIVGELDAGADGGGWADAARNHGLDAVGCHRDAPIAGVPTDTRRGQGGEIYVSGCAPRGRAATFCGAVWAAARSAA